MAVASGRTTICEVRVRASTAEEKERIGLEIEPLGQEETIREIEIYAEFEWTRRQAGARRGSDDDSESAAQELHRAIRGITGYAEYPAITFEGNLKRKRIVRPLEDVVPQFHSGKAFAAHLLERARLSARKKTTWWWEDSAPENLKALQKVFADVNQGDEGSAPLPKIMTVVVPSSYLQIAPNVTANFVDSRGLEGRVDGRRDIRNLLRDPNSIFVLCAPFKDAPGEELRALLRFMSADVELRPAILRTLLVLLDHGDADQVNNADGDREVGQTIKVEECRVALDTTQLIFPTGRDWIVAFDALKDEPERLRSSIQECIAAFQDSKRDSLAAAMREAENFLAYVMNEQRPSLCAAIDQQIKAVLANHSFNDSPLEDPLQGIYLAIDGCRYGSVVFATCRRNGAYYRFNLYDAVESEASREMTALLDTVHDAVREKLDDLREDPEFAFVRDHIELRRNQMDVAVRKVAAQYAREVYEEVEKKLEAESSLWQTCSNEWGSGGGFKNRVIDHLQAWSHRRPDLHAHERMDDLDAIPFWAEVARRHVPPRFTLHVRNLRALRCANFTPEPVSVLIGANGTGKTTLLQSLRLLRLTYELGLPEAVRIVLGGSYNMRSWGTTDEDSIEIGVDIGETSWRIGMNPREGLAVSTTEQLTERGRVVFARDALGGFTFRSENLDHVPQTGLRALMDRDTPDASVRRVAAFLKRISVHHDPDLWSLREQGSNTTEDRQLLPRYSNAITMLRRWYQELPNQYRYRFVIEGLNAAFPNTVRDLDFVEAGNTIVARIYRPGVETPSPLRDEANGVLQLLVILCALAAAEDESLVAIDEPENGLHPYAVRRFLHRATRFAKAHNLTIILATHAIAVLDELNGNPEQIFVMKSKDGESTLPTRLTDLCDPEWLKQFKVGTLYEEGEIGSNEDEI